MQEDRSFLPRQRIHVYEGGDGEAREVAAASVPWSDAEELHDTPSGHLFAAEEPSFSHGCVRVEDPHRLARHVLSGRAEAEPGQIESLIARDSTMDLELSKPLPVHIVSFTAIVQSDGKVGCRGAVYGIDRDLT